MGWGGGATAGHILHETASAARPRGPSPCQALLRLSRLGSAATVTLTESRPRDRDCFRVRAGRASGTGRLSHGSWDTGMPSDRGRAEPRRLAASLSESSSVIAITLMMAATESRADPAEPGSCCGPGPAGGGSRGLSPVPGPAAPPPSQAVTVLLRPTAGSQLSSD